MSKEVGATYVMRAAGSHTPVDLAVFFEARDGAIRNNDDPELGAFHGRSNIPKVWFVQCKKDGKLSDEDEEILVSLADEVGAIPVLAYQGQRGEGVRLVALDDRRL